MAADESEITPGPLEPGDVNVSGLGTQTAVTPEGVIAMRGAIPRPAGAFPSPTLPPWMPTAQQIAAQKAQEDQDFEMRKLQGQLSGLPYDQAQKATVAAMKLQGQRGYQADLAAGKPAHEALAKWAPMMFYENPQVFAGAVRQSFTQPRPAPRWVPADPSTGAPGHFESATGTIHVPTVQKPAEPAKTAVETYGGKSFLRVEQGGKTTFHPIQSPEKPGALTQVERDDLRFAEQQLGKMEKAQEEDLTGRRAMSKTEAEQTKAEKIAAAARSERSIKIRDLETKIKGYHDRVTKALEPAPPAANVVAPPGAAPAPAPTGPAVVAPPAAAPKQAMPLPSKQADLVVGQPYITKKGIYIWTGQKLRRQQ